MADSPSAPSTGYLNNTFQMIFPSSLISSPVILLLEVADRDEARAAPHSELVLLGGPFNTAGSAIDPEDDQSGLPRVTL